jgi:hypothetical protein
MFCGRTQNMKVGGWKISELRSSNPQKLKFEYPQKLKVPPLSDESREILPFAIPQHRRTRGAWKNYAVGYVSDIVPLCVSVRCSGRPMMKSSSAGLVSGHPDLVRYAGEPFL